jgi:hypothetical protein
LWSNSNQNFSNYGKNVRLASKCQAAWLIWHVRTIWSVQAVRTGSKSARHSNIAPRSALKFDTCDSMAISIRKFRTMRKKGSRDVSTTPWPQTCGCNNYCEKRYALNYIAALYDQVLTSSYGLILSRCGGRQHLPQA